MSTQSYSRQYLRELPEMKRRERQEQEFKEQLEILFHRIYYPLMAAAELGETKYLYDTTHWAQEQQQQQPIRLQQDHQKEIEQLSLLGRTVQISKKEQQFNAQMQTYQQARRSQQEQAPPEPPSQELLAGLKEKFPDCAVSFQEDWMETRQGVKELKKGILIDWS